MKIPKSYAILKTTGNGEKKLAYFTDPNCSYCKRFENVYQILITEVYIYMYPIIAQESVDITKRIWCSEDKIENWMTAFWMELYLKMKLQIAITNRKNNVFGEKLKIRERYTFFENGKRVPGAISASQLEEMLTNNWRFQFLIKIFRIHILTLFFIFLQRLQYLNPKDHP